MEGDMQWVSPIDGEPLRYRVLSRKDRTRSYLVDLEEFDGNGQCDCEHFTYRMKPLLDRGALSSPETRCYHIQLARRFFTDQQIKLVSRLFYHAKG